MSAEMMLKMKIFFFSDETVKFFCFQVLEHYIKTRYELALVIWFDPIPNSQNKIYNECVVDTKENFH